MLTQAAKESKQNKHINIIFRIKIQTLWYLQKKCSFLFCPLWPLQVPKVYCIPVLYNIEVFHHILDVCQNR